MTGPPRVLVAGIGNVFFGDDGFGVEVARRLVEREWPPGVVVADFGIRGIHLAFELLQGVDVLIAVDAVPRGEAPGSLYVIEPEIDGDAATADAHGMDLSAVFASARAMGALLPRLVVVGCEPLECEEMGLSEPIRQAIGPAVDLVRELVHRELAALARIDGTEVRP